MGVFNLTAVLTKHAHWLKDAEEVKPITEPLNSWIDQLPVRQLKAVEANLCPILLGVGLATVLLPDIILEMRIRESHRRPVGEAPEGAGRPLATQGGLTVVDGRPAPAGNGRTPSDGGSEDERHLGMPPAIPGVPC